MNGLEFNKLAAAVLVAGLLAMIFGNVADLLYNPEIPQQRGFQVAVTDEPAPGATAAAEVAPLTADDINKLILAANEQAGADQMKKCTACHALEKGGANKVGPGLWNVVNAAKGHHEGYAYSKALLEKGGNWDYESLFHFLQSPKKYINGTKMGFAGFNKPEDVANVIAHLRNLNDNPPPLPK